MLPELRRGGRFYTARAIRADVGYCVHSDFLEENCPRLVGDAPVQQLSIVSNESGLAWNCHTLRAQDGLTSQVETDTKGEHPYLAVLGSVGPVEF